MGTAKQPQPVKLIISLLTADTTRWDMARAALTDAYGPIDWESPPLPFHHTDYYEPEFGADLQRILLTFQQLIDPGDLPAIKNHTNGLEAQWTAEDRRRINLDPGYVSLSKLVLATTKNHAHRIYLADGIYGEVTLRYHQKAFRPWPWTYPDYASDDYLAMMAGIRARYVEQLHAM